MNTESAADSSATSTLSLTGTFNARIVEVEYGFTKNMGNYQSARLSCRSVVDPGTQPEDVYAELKAWVERMLPLSQDESYGLHYDVEALRSQKSALANDVQKLKLRYDKLLSKLKDLGFELPENPEDLPF